MFTAVVFGMELFQCHDSIQQIEMSRVNDGFCDCADGSDEHETFVCNNGQFTCQRELARDGYTLSCALICRSLRTIANSLVNDGICDCCDCRYV